MGCGDCIQAGHASESRAGRRRFLTQAGRTVLAAGTAVPLTMIGVQVRPGAGVEIGPAAAEAKGVGLPTLAVTLVKEFCLKRHPDGCKAWAKEKIIENVVYDTVTHLIGRVFEEGQKLIRYEATNFRYVYPSPGPAPRPR